MSDHTKSDETDYRETRDCDYCGKPLPSWKMATAETCSKRCALQRGRERREAARVAASGKIHPPLTGGCWDCGRAWTEPGWIDAWIPDDLWAQIAPIKGVGTNGSGHLCIHCITAALARIGATNVAVELWAAPYRVGGSVDAVKAQRALLIDYSAPGCICRNGGMGRRTDCPLHGAAAYSEVGHA